MKIRKIKGIRYAYDEQNRYLGRADKLTAMRVLEKKIENPSLVTDLKAVTEKHLNEMYDWMSSGDYLENIMIHQFEHYVREDILPGNKQELEALKGYIKAYGISPCIIDNFCGVVTLKAKTIASGGDLNAINEKIRKSYAAEEKDDS